MGTTIMAEQQAVEEVQKKKRTFRKFTFRGVDLDQFGHVNGPASRDDELPSSSSLRSWTEAQAYGPSENFVMPRKMPPRTRSPAVVKTHLRNMVIVPEMVGSVV